MKRYTNKDLRSNFVVTIQFYDKGGCNNMELTVNQGSLWHGSVDKWNMERFGVELEKSTLLNVNEKIGLSYFCKSYLDCHKTTMENKD